MPWLELPSELIPLSICLDGVPPFLLLWFEVPEGLSWKPVESTENKSYLFSKTYFCALSEASRIPLHVLL